VFQFGNLFLLCVTASPARATSVPAGDPDPRPAQRAKDRAGTPSRAARQVHASNPFRFGPPLRIFLRFFSHCECASPAGSLPSVFCADRCSQLFTHFPARIRFDLQLSVPRSLFPRATRFLSFGAVLLLQVV
jgi:hypothetical protein